MSGYPLDAFAIFKRCERISLIMADRKAKTAQAWIQAHPEIELVSRDRGGEYAACKWKEKVADFGTNTCRFLLHIARFGAILVANSEEILAVIPN
jgi:hypothetical protein